MAPSTIIEAPETGPDSGIPSRAVDKRSSAAVEWGGRGFMDPGETVRLLSRNRGPAQRRYGLDVYEQVDRDPAAGGSVEVLKFSVLSRDPQLVARRAPLPGKKPKDSAEQAAFDESRRRSEFCRWCLERLESPIVETSRDMLDALKWGATAADVVWDFVTDGPYSGKLVPVAVRPMEGRAWAFGVDGARRVKGLAVASSESTSGWEFWAREKFAVLTWGGRAGDPRGESIYDRAVEAWNFRAQVPIEHYLFLKRHGSPVPYVKPSEDAKPEYDPTLGREVTPAQDALAVAKGIRSGNAVGLPPGGEAGLLEPKGDGRVFDTAMDSKRREIVLAILLQARATVEAQNGSKADSDTSKDILDTMLAYIGRWLARMWEWDLLHKILLYNEGREAADLDTPLMDFGVAPGEDLAARLAGLAAVGYTLHPSQFPGIDAQQGMPERDMESVDDQQADGAIVPPEGQD